jgi:hypothetical protein
MAMTPKMISAIRTPFGVLSIMNLQIFGII